MKFQLTLLCACCTRVHVCACLGLIVCACLRVLKCDTEPRKGAGMYAVERLCNDISERILLHSHFARVKAMRTIPVSPLRVLIHNWLQLINLINNHPSVVNIISLITLFYINNTIIMSLWLDRSLWCWGSEVCG